MMREMLACALLAASATLFCGDVVAGDRADDWTVRSAGGRERVAVDWSVLGLVTALYNEDHLDEPLVSDLSRALRFVSAERTEGEDVYMSLTSWREWSEQSQTLNHCRRISDYRDRLPKLITSLHSNADAHYSLLSGCLWRSIAAGPLPLANFD